MTTELESISAAVPEDRSESESSLKYVLVHLVGIGVFLVLVMLAMAFGPAATGFGAVVAVLVFVLIVRRYRFSLRTFLVIVTLLSVWLGIKLNRDVKLNRALAGFANSGGKWQTQDRRPDFPWGLWRYRYSLNFYGLEEEIAEEDVSRLEVFAPSKLHRLDLSNTGITDESLRYVEDLIGLEFLSLANETYASGQRIPDRPQNEITDAGLARFSQLTKLRGIDLSGTDITDAGLESLAAMPDLMWVYLDGTQVKGPGLAHLRNQMELSMIELNGCSLSPVAYQELIQLPNLTSIGLRNSGATDDDLKVLKGTNRNLGILRLRDTKVSDEAVEEFSTTFPNCKIEW